MKIWKITDQERLIYRYRSMLATYIKENICKIGCVIIKQHAQVEPWHKKKRKRRKQGGKKTQLGANGANDSENAPQQSTSKYSNEKNAPELSQQSTPKDSNEKNAPEICQPSKSNDSNEKPPPTKCEDLIAHIATDMQQIQNVPKLQVGMAYYKSKVNNHKS